MMVCYELIYIQTCLAVLFLIYRHGLLWWFQIRLGLLHQVSRTRPATNPVNAQNMGLGLDGPLLSWLVFIYATFWLSHSRLIFLRQQQQQPMITAHWTELTAPYRFISFTLPRPKSETQRKQIKQTGHPPNRTLVGTVIGTPALDTQSTYYCSPGPWVCVWGPAPPCDLQPRTLLRLNRVSELQFLRRRIFLLDEKPRPK